MALNIEVPESANSSQYVNLGGYKYLIEYAYNNRDDSMRMSIYLDNIPVITGIKIMQNQRLLYRYNLTEFNHGDIVCYKNKTTPINPTLGNIGIGKDYELIYFSNEELEA